jgi:putative endonuclease
MKTYWVYILECKDKSYYTGVTNNLERRIHEHNNSSNIYSYTYDRRPCIIVHHEETSSIKDAIAREKQIK